ncbi:MAG: ABC transporter ATP-binding protein [Candidatus Dormibacteraeota bacterium]|uniref:ABC transporter ATP-binding protein n=1 Tax=Candidatus Dormiibacter inghamiae TaxID=3127013 RepID=A0A934KFC0_9BACT|nr:ABC transporter ATP-binding protein [Candidatus Dormibacteraeota bacterium]MBJ7604964.1 ABC transporter ATP-binding protein [Candidatus Dormibacteraeota bacterium]
MVRVSDLSVRVGTVEAVHSVGFELAAGRRTGLIGESGSGKTLTALAVMGLLPDGLSASGRAVYREQDLVALSEAELCRLRGDRLSMIFQEPLSALNPVQTIGEQVAEPLRLHRGLGGRESLARARELLERVQIPRAAEKLGQYPHQLSGGQRQRAMIAMAISCSPEVLIADEPTTALDVTVQAEVLRLLDRLVDEEGATLLLITHDLPVVAGLCDRVLVMYGGHLVEEGAVGEVFDSPRHPYTLALLESIPSLDQELPSGRFRAIPGAVPGLGQFPSGCPFRNRCPRATELCATMPALEGEGHRAACWHPAS